MKNKLIRRLVTCEIKQDARIKGREKMAHSSDPFEEIGTWRDVRCIN